MSASLVGSEMCIRDRERACRERESRDRFGAARLALRMPRAITYVPRAGAVSYTHLTLPTICSV
eukprot:5707451-Alexandrium_andersonii.AAC.1